MPVRTTLPAEAPRTRARGVARGRDAAGRYHREGPRRRRDGHLGLRLRRGCPRREPATWRPISWPVVSALGARTPRSER